MSSKFWRLPAGPMPATPEEVQDCMVRWLGYERWMPLVMSVTATRFMHEYYAAVEVLHMDPVTAYAAAWRAIYGSTTPNEENTP